MVCMLGGTERGGGGEGVEWVYVFNNGGWYY